VYDFFQFRVLHLARGPSYDLDAFDARVQQAFPQNTLPYHAGCSENNYVHAFMTSSHPVKIDGTKIYQCVSLLLAISS
jgi:hypothetical protein